MNESSVQSLAALVLVSTNTRRETSGTSVAKCSSVFGCLVMRPEQYRVFRAVSVGERVRGTATPVGQTGKQVGLLLGRSLKWPTYKNSKYPPRIPNQLWAKNVAQCVHVVCFVDEFWQTGADVHACAITPRGMWVG